MNNVISKRPKLPEEVLPAHIEVCPRGGQSEALHRHFLRHRLTSVSHHVIEARLQGLLDDRQVVQPDRLPELASDLLDKIENASADQEQVFDLRDDHAVSAGTHSRASLMQMLDLPEGGRQIVEVVMDPFDRPHHLRKAGSLSHEIQEVQAQVVPVRRLIPEIR